MAAFASSVTGTEGIQMGVSEADSHTDLSSVLLHLEAARGVLTTKEEVAGMTQKLLSASIDQFRHTQLVSTFEEMRSSRDVIHLKSLSLPKAGSWLNAVPSKNRNLNFRKGEFNIVSRYRLGAGSYHIQTIWALPSL
jgi:hypothetical protein